MTWKAEIAGCFAGLTAPFGLHPNDEERAKAMFVNAINQGANFLDIETEIRSYLARAQGWPVDVDKEVERARELFLSMRFHS